VQVLRCKVKADVLCCKTDGASFRGLRLRRPSFWNDCEFVQFAALGNLDGGVDGGLCASVYAAQQPLNFGELLSIDVAGIFPFSHSCSFGVTQGGD
jgi:hypothetical protein